MNELKVIAYIHTDFPEKFGVPRQSGLVEGLTGVIEFTPEYRDAAALKGIEEYSHLWLLWEFEGVERGKWLKQVRPPRLGGNETRGVFATRSPFRPNPVGLSSVRLLKVDYEAPNGPLIYVSGIDTRDNTPIFDIKPYLAYADSHPEASNGFAGEVMDNNLEVSFPDLLLNKLPSDKQAAIIEILNEDPRPHYHDDPDRIYGLSFAGFNIRFYVNQSVLYVISVEPI